MEPDDCLVECGSGQSNYTALLAPCFGNDAGRNNSLNIAATILYRGVAAINGQSVAARVSAADLVDATWLGHQPGLAAGGETATVAAGLRFQPTCAGTARVDVILEFVGDDGFFDTPVALPLVQLAVYGLGGSGGFNVTVMASEAGGLFAFQAGLGVIADIAGRSGEVKVTIAAPGAAADVARADGAAVLLLGGVNSSILRFAAVCALGARPAPLTVALSGVAPPGIAAIPPTFIAPKRGLASPAPPELSRPSSGPTPACPALPGRTGTPRAGSRKKTAACAQTTPTLPTSAHSQRPRANATLGSSRQAASPAHVHHVHRGSIETKLMRSVCLVQKGRTLRGGRQRTPRSARRAQPTPPPRPGRPAWPSASAELGCTGRMRHCACRALLAPTPTLRRAHGSRASGATLARAVSCGLPFHI